MENRKLLRATWKAALLLAVVGAAILSYQAFGQWLSIETLATREAELLSWKQQRPAWVFGIAFFAYVAVTGLSVPGATALTLVFGWYFKWLPGVLLVSFASTTGATVAFLLCRYLFRDAVERRFGNRLQKINSALEREGPYYLFTMRLIPAIPFFVINAVMGLTPIRVRTFWWVSQLGMLPATIVYVYAGASVPSLQVLAEEGVEAVFEPRQLLRLGIAFAALGCFPLVARQIVRLSRGPTARHSQNGTVDEE